MSKMPPPEALARAVSHVTSTMLGFSVAHVERTENNLLWRTAALSIPGAHPLSVAISSNEVGCAAVGSALFSCRPEEVDPTMIDDSLCELVNMAAGQIRTLMALDQALGLPKVGAGRGPGVDDNDWNRVVLSAGRIELLLSLTNRVL
jgi:hypothetical protein